MRRPAITMKRTPSYSKRNLAPHRAEAYVHRDGSGRDRNSRQYGGERTGLFASGCYVSYMNELRSETGVFVGDHQEPISQEAPTTQQKKKNTKAS